ncbi:MULTISPECIES: glycosyltransferase [Winogradskyella]|uniref:Glycosyltransferase family 4 protein n=1 Tax=Winogradskyella damuponensis TaxID=943939 RepID=A0ABP8CWD5_9FLAO
MRPKIIICSKDLEAKGGVANFYRELNEVWNYQSHQLVYFNIGSHSSDYVHREKRYFGYLTDSIRQYREFYRFLKREKPNKVVVNPSLIPIAIIRDGIYVLISKYLKIKSITFVRGWREGFFNRRFLSYFFKSVYKNSSEFIVLSKKFKTELEKHFKGHNIHVVYTTYDNSQLQERKTKSSDEIIKMVYISRISELKGIMELLEALKLLVANKYTSFSMDIYGHYRSSEIEEKINDFLSLNPEVKSKINILGFIDKTTKYEVLSQSHVFLLPSYMEGCPNAVIEATASGCFVIATNVGAIPEIVEDGFNAFLVAPKKVLQLKDAIASFLDNKSFYLENCSESKLKIKDRFEINAVRNQLYNIFVN